MAEANMNLAVFDPIRTAGAELLRKDVTQEFDHTTPEGEKALRSWVHRLRGYKGDIEKCRKGAKATAIEYGRKVDDMARELTIMPVRLIAERMKPLDEIEAAKRAAAEAIIETERVAAEKAEADRLADLKRREDEVARKEVKQKAAEDAANAEQREGERVEREKRIATYAAESAREEAERKAKAEADERERGRVLAIQMEQDEKERVATLEAERIADESHRKKIHAEIKGELWEFLPGELADKTTEALIAGKIPHVKILY